MSWTAEKVQELRDYCGGDEKLSSSQIGRRMGFSRSAIIGKASRMGISLPANNTDYPRAPCDTTASRSKIPVKKARKHLTQPLPVFSDTLDPITDEIPPRGSQCRFISNQDPRNPDYCPNKKQIGSYCADHYLLTSGDKELAKRAIERLT